MKKFMEDLKVNKKKEVTFSDFFFYYSSNASVTAPIEAQETSLAYLPITPFEYNLGATQSLRRLFNSSSETSIEISCFLLSIVTISPSSRWPIGPPDCASGATWPITKP